MVRPQFRKSVAAMVAAMALVSAACSSGGGGGSSSAAIGPPEKTNILVAAVPTSDSAGLYIAQARGLFAQEGLHVTIEPAISGKTVLSAQLAGKIDVTLGNYVSYILAEANGAKLRILAAGSVMAPNVQEIMVPANSKITAAAQLAGKRIAVNVTGNIGTLLIDSVLSNNAILPGPNTVKFVPMPFPDMAQALATGKVDAAWMSEPFVSEAEMAIGAQPIADADTGVTQNLPIAGYVVTQAWAHKYPNTAARFQQAIEEGQQLANTDSGAVNLGIIKYAHVPQGAAAITANPAFPVKLDPVSIQRIANLMLQFGMLQKNFDTSAMTH